MFRQSAAACPASCSSPFRNSNQQELTSRMFTRTRQSEAASSTTVVVSPSDDPEDPEGSTTKNKEDKLILPRTSLKMRTEQHVPELPPSIYCLRPLVLATHLVPSLPISLFEVLAQAIEIAVHRPVVIMHESRVDRPVASAVVDIAVLPVGEDWEDGDLLPVSFVFDHKLNKTFSPEVYVDVVVATDRAHHVETLFDLRGHRCALPDRKKYLGATTLLFNELRIKGDGPAFFGSLMDAKSHLGALQMITGKQVEVCVLESPILLNHKKMMQEGYSLHVLKSLGPLPPYPILTNKKSMTTEDVKKIKEFLLDIHNKPEWLAKFAPFSVLGFAEYSVGNMGPSDIKPVKTAYPYY